MYVLVENIEDMFKVPPSELTNKWCHDLFDHEVNVVIVTHLFLVDTICAIL